MLYECTLQCVHTNLFMFVNHDDRITIRKCACIRQYFLNTLRTYSGEGVAHRVDDTFHLLLLGGQQVVLPHLHWLIV